MRRLITLFGSLVLALAVMSPAMARQEPSDEAGTDDLLKDIPGLESAWAKRYDNPSLHDHIAENTEPADVSINILSITILEFESEGMATLAFGMALSDDTAAMILHVDPEGIVADDTLDLGDQATRFSFEDDTETAVLVAVREGNLGYLIMAWGDGTDPTEVATGVGEFMVAAEPGDGEIVFEATGESHGGLFDLFPRAGDDALHGLVPMYEYNLLVSDKPMEYPATPEA